MLLWLSQLLSEHISGFQVFSYLTLRAILGVLTALLLSLWIGPSLIRLLTSYRVGQTVRDNGPQSHLSKAGTPTMGGVLILIAIVLSTLLWADLSVPYIWIVLFVTVSFGLIGGVDDYKKLVLKDPKGLSSRFKLLWQSIFAIITACLLFYIAELPAETSLFLPFLKNFSLNLGMFYIILTYFVIVGSSNAVNLTDGLDGLAIMPTILIAGALGVFAYVSGHIEFANYLAIPYLPGTGELVIFCGAIFGAGLGFLWFNTYPAQIFMGDVGSLSLGAVLGTLAVMVRQEVVFFIMSGIFVMETISVILQVGSYKLRGKRIFKMAPLHHHFELKGWPEPRVIVRFWIITVILVLVGLATLKIR